MIHDINVLAFRKDNDSYVFMYDDTQDSQILAIFKRYAEDPTLNFSESDAEVLADKVTILREQYITNAQYYNRKLFGR